MTEKERRELQADLLLARAHLASLNAKLAQHNLAVEAERLEQQKLVDEAVVKANSEAARTHEAIRAGGKGTHTPTTYKAG
jgi:hypothetical protein